MAKKKDKKKAKETISTMALLFVGQRELSNIACSRFLELVDGPLSETFSDDVQAFDEAIFLLEVKKAMAAGHKKILVNVLDDEDFE